MKPPITPTNQKNRVYYTLHTSPNTAFTLKPSVEGQRAIVGFRDMADAATIGNMIETHYIEKKEWPETKTIGDLVLPEGRLTELVYVTISQWDFENLKFECTKNMMNLISVNKILKKKSKYSFSGELYQFTAPIEFYQTRFNELVQMPDLS